MQLRSPLRRSSYSKLSYAGAVDHGGNCSLASHGDTVHASEFSVLVPANIEKGIALSAIETLFTSRQLTRWYDRPYELNLPILPVRYFSHYRSQHASIIDCVSRCKSICRRDAVHVSRANTLRPSTFRVNLPFLPLRYISRLSKECARTIDHMSKYGLAYHWGSFYISGDGTLDTSTVRVDVILLSIETFFTSQELVC